MTYAFQVVLDCRDPHAQADWWADVLGWNVEQTQQVVPMLALQPRGQAVLRDHGLNLSVNATGG